MIRSKIQKQQKQAQDIVTLTRLSFHVNLLIQTLTH